MGGTLGLSVFDFGFRFEDEFEEVFNSALTVSNGFPVDGDAVPLLFLESWGGTFYDLDFGGDAIAGVKFEFPFGGHDLGNMEGED
jgi:hypothetical protein